MEQVAQGIPFGANTGERLVWLDEAAGIVRRLLQGETVTHHGNHYHLDHVRHAPLTDQTRLFFLIGGGRERCTRRTVAAHTDLWNVFGTPKVVGRKAAILDQPCAAIRRDPSEIERTVAIKLVIRDTAAEVHLVWTKQATANGMRVEDYDDVLLGPPSRLAEALSRYREHGFSTVIADAPAPNDQETIERMASEVPSLKGA